MIEDIDSIDMNVATNFFFPLKRQKTIKIKGQTFIIVANSKDKLAYKFLFLIKK